VWRVRREDVMWGISGGGWGWWGLREGMRS